MACYQTAVFNTTSCTWNVTGTPPIAPTGNTSQTFNFGQTLADLTIVGINIVWYQTLIDAQNHTNELNSSTLLIDGNTYYAIQIIDGCYSITALAVNVTLVLKTISVEKDQFNYYPNPVETNLYFENSSLILDLTLSSILGQKIYNKEVNSITSYLDMSRLPSGTYLLNIRTLRGTKNIKLLKK